MRAAAACDAAEALELYREAPTHAARPSRRHDPRRASIPSGVVTYIIDRNVNYTNICVARCNFCAFYRPVGSREGYVLGFEEIFQQDRRDDRRRRQPAAAAGRAQSRPADPVVRGSVPRGEGAVSGVQAARAVAAGGAAHLAAQSDSDARRSSSGWSRPVSTAFPAAAPRSWSIASASC